jgi:hypothetical protein
MEDPCTPHSIGRDKPGQFGAFKMSLFSKEPYNIEQIPDLVIVMPRISRTCTVKIFSSIVFIDFVAVVETNLDD